MKKQVLLRIDASQLEKIKEASEHFRETVTSFFLKSALLRMQTGQSPAQADPFDDALARLRREKPGVALSSRAQAALRADREASRKGSAKSLPASKGAELFGKALREIESKKRSK